MLSVFVRRHWLSASTFCLFLHGRKGLEAELGVHDLHVIYIQRKACWVFPVSLALPHPGTTTGKFFIQVKVNF